MTIEDSTSSLPAIDRFSEFVKASITHEKRTINTEINSETLIFHRDFARYRHLPCPDSTTGFLLPGFMEPTWINVILVEARVKQLALVENSRKFCPLNNEIDENAKGTISDLLTDLSEKPGNERGENVGKKITRRNIDPILKGIQQTIGFNFSDNNHLIPVSTLKLISLLYKILKGRSKTVFQLIKSLRDTDSYSLEYGNNTPNPRSEENSLLIADLISYLNVLVPIERLHLISQVILDADMMWNTIADHNRLTREIIRATHDYNKHAVYATYRNMAEAISYYRQESDFERDIEPAETMQTLLRTLHFKNSIGEYLDIFYSHHIEIKSVKSFIGTTENICLRTSKEANIPINLNDKIISINEFHEFIFKYESDFRDIFELAKGTYARPDQTQRLINRSKILLLLYIRNTHQTTETNKRLISILDCAVAIYTVGIQMHKGKHHSPFVFGQNTPGESILDYFDKCENIQELIAKDNIIPQSVKHIMYRKFCQIHSYLTGDEEGHDSYTLFENAKLMKISECLNSNNAEKIKTRIESFLNYCESIAIKRTLPTMPESTVLALQAWANQGRHKP